MEGRKSWQSVVYQKKDRFLVVQLFKKHYAGTEVARAEFLRWQYEKNPAGKAVIRLAKNEKGEIVGFYCVMPQRFLINGKEMLGSVSLNTLVDENYRRMGIFSTLALDCYADCVKRGIKFTLGFPNPSSYPGFANRLEFGELAEVPLLIRPINWWGLIKKKLKLTDGTKAVVKETKNNKINWPEVKRKENTTIRGTKFLNWRTNWPVRGYKVVVEGEGYVVLRVVEVDGIRTGFVSDMWLGQGKDEIGKKLLKLAVDYFLKKSVDLAGCLMMPGTEEYRSLRQNGFWPCPFFLKPQPMRAMVRWHKGRKPAGFLDGKNWFLTMLDYDVG